MRRVQLTEQGRGPKNRTCLGLLTICTSEVCLSTLWLGGAGAESCRAGPPPGENRWIVQSWTSKVFFLLFRSLACGCRFGSGAGCFSVGACRTRFCPWFRSVSVWSNSERKKGTDPKTGSHFLIGIPFTRCSGTLDLSIRSIASAGHMVMCVGDRRFPGATILGVEVMYFLRQPSGVSRADRSRTF